MAWQQSRSHVQYVAYCVGLQDQGWGVEGRGILMSEGSEAFRSSSRGAIVTYGLARTLINACAIATLALTPQSAPAWAQSENQPVGSTTLEVATQVGSTSQRTMAS